MVQIVPKFDSFENVTDDDELTLKFEYNVMKESDVEDDKNYIRVDANLINNQDSIRSMVLEKINNGDEVIFVDAIIEFNNGETFYDRVYKIYDDINPELIYVLESFILNLLAG